MVSQKLTPIKYKSQIICYSWIKILSLIMVVHSSVLAQNKEDRPNIIFIMADDHAANAISSYQSRLSKIALTPNIDRIGHEGIRFENGFCTNSICTPSRAVVLTGLHSHKNGVLDLEDMLDSTKNATSQDLIRKSGYYTGMIGKWHLLVKPFGFDYWKVLVGQGQYHNPFYWEKNIGWDPEKNGAKQYKGYVTDINTNMAIDFLESRPKEKPFFLMLHFKAPHDRWDNNKKYDSLYTNVDIPEPLNLFDKHKTRGKGIRECTQTIGNCHTAYSEETKGFIGANRKRKQYQVYMKKYLRCVASIDENVGRVLDYLDQKGLNKNTLIVYTSDQGFFLGEHGLYDKRFMYEESMRIPLLVRYPDKIKAGQINNELVSNLDFAETFLDYAGIGIPDKMQGRSLRPLFESKDIKWRYALYYRYWMHGAHFNVPAHLGIRTKSEKLMFFYGNDLGTHPTMRYQDGEYKGISTITKPWKVENPYWEYYNLTTDNYEMKNLYKDGASKSRIKELKKKLVELRVKYEDLDDNFPEMKEIVNKFWN